MNLEWNVVSKKLHPHEPLRERLRSKVSKLERCLPEYPLGSVRLQVALTRHPHNGQFSVAFTLRVPSKLLRSKKSAADPVTALDLAAKAMEREIHGLRTARRRGTDRARTVDRKRGLGQLAYPGEMPPEPQEQKGVPQELRETVSQQYDQMVYHIRREIWRAETEGWPPRHALDAEAIADEVICQAFARAGSKPSDQSYRVWLYELARHELQRRFKELRERTRTSVSLNASKTEQAIEDDRDNEPLALVEGPLHGDEVELQDLTPDDHVSAPDREALEHDLAEYLRQRSEQWPREQRAVFELYFLEGFEPDEVAMLEKMAVTQVRELIDQVQARVRQAVTEAAQATASAQRRSARATPRSGRLSRART